jgi:hypothetical protein
MKNPYEVNSQVKFKGETTVLNTETKETKKAEYRFVGSNPVINKEAGTITFDLVTDGGCEWMLVINDQDEMK